MTTSTLKTTDIRSRIEPELKSQASAILADCGLNISDAVRLFLRQVVAQQGLPFAIRQPNATTLAAMEQANKMTKARFKTAKTLFNDLEKNNKPKTRKATKKQ